MESRVFDDEQIASFCLDKLGARPDVIERPGGATRKTVVVEVNSQRLAISKRNSTGRAQLEAEVLSKLGSTKAVPGLILQSGRYVVQECVSGQRFPEVLETSSEKVRTERLFSAGKTLVELQKAGLEQGLITQAPAIGDRPKWYEDFASAPLRLAEQMGFEDPVFNVPAVVEKIRPKDAAFVKWDSRPGNCISTNDMDVIWFDWEHCGVGSSEDDLVWLLADEWAPISLKAEQDLLRLAAENGSLSLDEMTFRFRAKAVIHSAIRLGLIFHRKGDGPWWNARSAMKFDHVGVTLPHVRRVCRRAQIWASESPGLDGLFDVFDRTLDYAELLPDPA